MGFVCKYGAHVVPKVPPKSTSNPMASMRIACSVVGVPDSYFLVPFSPKLSTVNTVLNHPFIHSSPGRGCKKKPLNEKKINFMRDLNYKLQKKTHKLNLNFGV